MSFVACECFDSSFALPQSRMLSRYLPVRKDDFDLHGYIEVAGHNPDACFHLAITDKTCRGFLVKMGGKIKTWKKRWFVFDQNRRTLTYYAGGSRPWPVLSALPTTGWVFRSVNNSAHVICRRQTRDQDERSHLLPGHRGGLLRPPEECAQSKSARVRAWVQFFSVCHRKHSLHIVHICLSLSSFLHHCVSISSVSFAFSFSPLSPSWFLKRPKSPNPSLTFSVKTHDRVYYMVAPSPEAMRIWMDVVVTGAEGHMHFMV